MTVHELHYAVRAGLNQTGTFAGDGYLDEELDFHLTQTQDRLVLERLRLSPEGLVGEAGKLDDLSQLLVPDYTDQITDPEEGRDEVFVKPKDYLALIAAAGMVGEDEDHVRSVPLDMLDPQQYYRARKNPFRRSTLTRLVGTLSSEGIRVMGGKRFILKGLTYDYVRMPKPIAVSLNRTSELAPGIHHELVGRTVSHLLENGANPRYQTSLVENKSVS